MRYYIYMMYGLIMIYEQIGAKGYSLLNLPELYITYWSCSLNINED